MQLLKNKDSVYFKKQISFVVNVLKFIIYMETCMLVIMKMVQIVSRLKKNNGTKEVN